ncbi:diguanylate cyclase domain-containing protein [Sulfuricurvum sp.]|uniref:diguanylate cyclase domain-containing protein n=1 Tax=Sulfuricurvum sp. TaxID=2025608 RepID=UPI003BB01968
MRRYSITTKIFVSHLFLVIVLIVGLSYKHYNDQIEQYKENIVQVHSASSYAIVSTCSDAIAGENYANLQMGEFVNELKRNHKLLMMMVEGRSDYSSAHYKAYYDKKKGELWRGTYPQNFEQQTSSQIASLKERLSNPSTDKVKIEFLIARLEDMKRTYFHDRHMSAQMANQMEPFLKTSDTTVDFEAKRLYIALKTDNKNGGTVHLAFDISEIASIRQRILDDIIMESIIALALSLIVLGLLSANIVRPIKSLSEYLKGDFGTLNPKNIPSKEQSDEIGLLAGSFSQLLEQMQGYIARLEQINKNDPLTGLLNRRAFDEIFANMDKQFDEHAIGALYLDIDHFKRYNDTYGHNAGDVALQKVAKAIENSLQRKGDYAFRLGGEEFAVIISADNEAQMLSIAERMRKNVEELKIEHTENVPYGYVTISIGASFEEYHEGINPKTLLERADKALYNAKAEGKNSVSIFS